MAAARSRVAGLPCARLIVRRVCWSPIKPLCGGRERWVHGAEAKRNIKSRRCAIIHSRSRVSFSPSPPLLTGFYSFSRFTSPRFVPRIRICRESRWLVLVKLHTWWILPTRVLCFEIRFPRLLRASLSNSVTISVVNLINGIVIYTLCPDKILISLQS